ALRTLGFRYVVEVARGADLVATAYEELLRNDPDGSWIATACPAIVERIRKYHPALLPRLAPIVSPMIAAALELRELHGDDLNCVFIGPCIAKKVEARDPLLPRVVDEALTFAELRRVFAQRGIDPSQAASSEPDPPRAGTGKAFPLIGGLLLSAGLESDPLDDRFIVATGRTETEEILTDLEQGGIRPRLVKALMCHGCHEGPLPPLRVRHTMRFSEASPPRIGGLLNQARNRSATSSPVRITFRQRMNSTAAHADIPPAGPRRLPSSMALPKKRCACPF
ncbi:MAG: hypothetical protein GXX84_08820, partial [Acidobacteria bacterium]|nr:hypothetical protein [Acidobacteriota bacterium]